MAKLQDLPTELLSHIVSFVAAGETPDGALFTGGSKEDWETIDGDESIETEDLYNLCLVSHKFRALAQPVLFQYFDEDHVAEDYSGLISFTRTIILRPNLGECISPPKDLELFKTAVRDLGVGREEAEQKWFKAIEARDFSVFLALLLSKTPNLTTLALPAGGFFPTPVSHLFTHIPSFLSKLKSLIVSGDQLYPGHNIDSFLEFFSLPHLKDVIVDDGDLVEANCPSWAPGSLSIESLFFKLCHIDPGSIKRLVRGSKKLTSFALTNFSPNPRQARYGDGFPQFNAVQLHAELLAHKDTLTKLHFEENYSDSTKIGSLREFSVLDQISIQHELLPPKPLFPASLKILYITDCNSSIRDMTQHIADECRKGLLPALRTFKVLSLDITQPIKLPGQRIPNGQTPEQCFLSIKNKFQGTEVDFQICPYAFDEEDLEDDYDDEFDPYGYEYNYDSDDDFGPMGESRMASALLQALRDEGNFAMRHG